MSWRTTPLAPPWPLTWVQERETGRCPGQHHGERLEHQGVARRPEVDLLAIGERDPVEQAEAIAPGRKRGADAVLLLRPIAAKLPDIGVIGIVPPPFAQRGEGGIQDAIRGNCGKKGHGDEP